MNVNSPSNLAMSNLDPPVLTSYPVLNIAKIDSFSKYCFAINDTRFLDIVFTDAIKDVTDSVSKYLDFSKTLHRSPPSWDRGLGTWTRA